MVRDKVRIRFRKDGALRLVSHHDLMRCFERMLRRAALPFHSTQGYNPKPRLVFGLSLALGIIGCDEVVELELDETLSIEEIHQCLARQAPDGLTIRSVRRIDAKASARVRRVCYRLPLPAPRDDVAERIHALLAAPNCWVERTRPQARRIDIRPYLRALHIYPDALEMDLWVTPHGSARPDEVVKLLGLSELLEAGAVLERTLLELEDECGEPAPSHGENVVSVNAFERPDQKGTVPLPQGDSPLLVRPPVGGAPATQPYSPDDVGTPSCERYVAASCPATQAEGNA
jgi:radical SAM-linked protein